LVEGVLEGERLVGVIVKVLGEVEGGLKAPFRVFLGRRLLVLHDFFFYGASQVRDSICGKHW